VSTALAYAILAAELAAGWSLCGLHSVRGHGQPARALAALRRLPAPPVTPHHAWWDSRPAALRAAVWVLAAGLDTALALAWLAGHRGITVAVLGAADIILAILIARHPARAHVHPEGDSCSLAP
jgi:hypothetical protein